MKRQTPQSYTRITITRQGEQKRSFSLPVEQLNGAVERVEQLIGDNTNGFIKGSITTLQLREISGTKFGASRTMRYYGLTVNQTERLIKEAFGIPMVGRIEKFESERVETL
jgi:hypothetical protein